MLSKSFEYRNEPKRVAMRRAIVFVAPMDDRALAAPAGEILSRCEAQGLDAGRDLLRATVQQAVPARVDRDEEKGAARVCTRGHRRRPKRHCGRETRTALGTIEVRRWHSRCGSCGRVGFVTDERLGLDGGLTAQARRMACLAGIHEPFRKAERILQELAGWSLDAETLRRLCHAETRQRRPRVAHRRGQVNTPEGWRDVKVAVFAARERAAVASSADLTQRDLPEPSVRSVVAAVEEAEAFGARCQREAKRLALTEPRRRSVLGDGAEWIGNLADARFGGAKQLLDAYHALEYLAQVGRAAIGDGEPLVEWLESAKRKRIGDDYAGVCEVVVHPPSDPEAQRRVGEVVGPVLNSFAAHRCRMGDAVRLHRGQVIGSGLVKGTIKEFVNLRMKRTGARWRAERVGRFVEFMALAKSPEWDEHWAKPGRA